MDFEEINFEEVIKTMREFSCSCKEFIENINWFLDILKEYQV